MNVVGIYAYEMKRTINLIILNKRIMSKDKGKKSDKKVAAKSLKEKRAAKAAKRAAKRILNIENDG